MRMRRSFKTADAIAEDFKADEDNAEIMQHEQQQLSLERLTPLQLLSTVQLCARIERLAWRVAAAHNLKMGGCCCGFEPQYHNKNLIVAPLLSFFANAARLKRCCRKDAWSTFGAGRSPLILWCLWTACSTVTHNGARMEEGILMECVPVLQTALQHRFPAHTTQSICTSLAELSI
jgi:hypothetical protein